MKRTRHNKGLHCNNNPSAGDEQMISSSSKQSTVTDFDDAENENVQQTCQASLPKKRSISESSVGKAVSSSSKRPVNSNVTDRQRSTDQHYPDSAHFSSHIVQNLSSNDNENTSVIQLTSTEINDESPTAESLKAHSELIDLTCSDDDGDNDDHQQIDSDLSVGVENPESHRTLQSQPLSQQHPSCGQSKILRSSCASSSSSSRPSCMVAAGRSSTFAQQEIQHRPHGSQYCLRQSSFEEAPHLSTDMDPLSSNHLPISAGLNRETIGVLNVTQAPPPPPCHQPDCPHAMCTCHAHCPFCSVNTTLNVAPPPTVQGAPHYFVGCDLHSPCPGQCYHATHMQTMPAIVDPVAAPPPPNVTLTSVPSCRNSTSSSSRTTPLINAADAHVAPPSSSNAPFFELVTLGQGSMTTLASQPPHYHHHHHHYQCIRTPVICPGVYSMPAQSFFSQTASPQPHHLVEVELNVTAPRANSLATFYDHPQAPSSVVHHTANLHMTPVDQAQNSSMSSIRAEFPTQQATPTPPLTQQRLLERQQDYMSRRREAQVRWFDRQRSSQIMSNSSRYPPQYHPARGASFRYAPDANATPNTIAAVNVMLRHQQPHHHHQTAQAAAAAAVAAATATVDPVLTAATAAAAAAASSAAAGPAAVYYNPYVNPLFTLGGFTPPAFQWAVAPQPETREDMYINSAIRHSMSANAEPFTPVVGVSYGANNPENVAMQAAMRLLQPPQVFSSSVASVAAAVAATAATMPWRSPYVLVDRNAPMLNFEQHFLRHMAESMDLPQGASPTLIEQCTTKCNYKMPAEKPVAGEEEKCPVCLSEFENDEHVRYLPCNHWFHVDCIDRWLSTNKKCPVCRLHIDRDRQQNHHQQQQQLVGSA